MVSPPSPSDIWFAGWLTLLISTEYKIPHFPLPYNVHVYAFDRSYLMKYLVCLYYKDILCTCGY